MTGAAHSQSQTSVRLRVPGSCENPWAIAAAAVALVVLTVWLWSPALRFGFIYDDHVQIESNLWIQSWSHLGSLLRQPLWSQLGPEHASPYFRPLFSLWLLIQYALLGPDPELWHAASIALEAIVTLALFAFLQLHFRRWLPAFAGAVFFACSPLTAEVVDWVSASDEALYSVLLLLALCALQLSAGAADRTRALLLRWCCAGLLGLAVLAKETAIVGALLAMAWVLLVARDRTARRSGFAGWWMFSVPVAVYLLAHRSLHTAGTRAAAQALAAMPYAALLGLRKLLWPLPVSAFYDLWLGQPHSALSIAVHAGAVVLIAAALVWAARRTRFVAWALLVVGLPMAVSVGSIGYFRDYDLFHDRYLYLPAAGVAMLVAAAVAKATSQTGLPRGGLPRLVLGSVCILVCVEAGLSRSVSRQFSGDIPLFSHAVQVAPHNIVAQQLLGDGEFKMNDCRTALSHYGKAAELRPDLWKTSFFLGVASARCGDNRAGAASFTRAAAVPAATSQQAALAWYELGRVRIAMGDIGGARVALEQAALREPASDPGSAKISNLLTHISPARSGH